MKLSVRFWIYGGGQTSLILIFMAKTIVPVIFIEEEVYGFNLKQLLLKKQYEQPVHKEVLALTLKLLRSDLPSGNMFLN